MGSRCSKRVFFRMFRPMRWSIKARRVFMVVLPLAIPVWLIAVMSVLVLGFTLEAAKAIKHAWNAPPEQRRVSSYSYYGYGK